MPTSSWSLSDKARRLGSLTVVSAASGAMLFGFAGTAAAAVPTQQTLDPEPNKVTSGTELTFTGKLTGFGGRALAGEQVKLQTRSGPDDSWSLAETDKTDANGVASIPVTINESAQWRISYAGDRVHDGSTSNSTTVESSQPINRQLVEAAAAQAGKPYKYGADGPNSFDCSGLTQYVHKQVGIDLPRTTQQQRAAVPEISKSDMKPGDLVFFHNGGSAYHVGIYAGNNKIWAAPEQGEDVQLQEIWTDSYTVGRAW